jgi:hypothetical protein
MIPSLSLKEISLIIVLIQLKIKRIIAERSLELKKFKIFIHQRNTHDKKKKILNILVNGLSLIKHSVIADWIRTLFALGCRFNDDVIAIVDFVRECLE